MSAPQFGRDRVLNPWAEPLPEYPELPVARAMPEALVRRFGETTYHRVSIANGGYNTRCGAPTVEIGQAQTSIGDPTCPACLSMETPR